MTLRIVMAVGLLAIGCTLGGCEDKINGPKAAVTPQRKLTGATNEHDPEAATISAFKSRRAAFDDLKSMILADTAVARVAPGSSGKDRPSELSQERFDQYVSKLATAGAASVATKGDKVGPGEVRFEIQAPTAWPAGSRASIVYSKATGLPRVDNVADVLSKNTGVSAARELEVNWYLVGEN